MKRLSVIYISLLLISIYAEAMQIISQSRLPLKVYYACPGQEELSITIIAGSTRFTFFAVGACCVTKIELQGYPEYNVVQKDVGACSKITEFTIPKEIDDVFAYQAYNANDLTVLQFLINNKMDPAANLSNTMQMKIENNEPKVTAILAQTSRLRGGISGTGLQRYKAILPAAVYDGKVDMVKLILKNSTVDLKQMFAGSTLLQIADLSQSSNKTEIKNLLQS